VEDPDGKLETIYTKELPVTREIETRTVKYSSDPLKAILDDLAITINRATRTGKIEEGKVGRTTTTIYVANANGDGTIWSGDEFTTWAAAREIDPARVAWPSGEGVSVFNWTGSGKYQIYRGFVAFDTSVIGTDTITSADVLIRHYKSTCVDCSGKTLDLVASPQANKSLLQAIDYNPVGTTVFGEVAIDDIATSPGNAIETYTLNASGLAYIDKTGTTTLAVLMSMDTDNSAPTGYNYVIGYDTETTGTASDPRIVIVHEAAAAAPTGEEYFMIFQ
jgi:hypothetical protein